jgi:DNA-binding response OmpR family regulator
MKKILLYSSDFVMSISFLMYLQNKYSFTITTDLKDFGLILQNADFDIIIMDAEPSKEAEEMCRNIHRLKSIPIFFLYVYSSALKEFDKQIRKYVKLIFYKPFDLYEVTNALDTLAA